MLYSAASPNSMETRLPRPAKKSFHPETLGGLSLDRKLSLSYRCWCANLKDFTPHLEVLPPAQRQLWDELSTVPKEFVLYGGTALALHLGHRDSIDFDFFGCRALNTGDLEKRMAFLSKAKVVQREENTLSAVVNRGQRVKVSFFGVPNLPRLASPHVAPDNGLQVASLL